ncbi:MAG: glycosyltransferase family 87 protein [Acidimicrobiales bacterium]
MSRPAGARVAGGPLRTVYFTLLVLWVVLLPLAVHGNLAQDALPFFVAGELSASDPGAVYSTSGDLFDPTPAFARRSCELAPVGTDCAQLTVTFVSPPPALLVGRAAGVLGADVAATLFRVLGAACLAGGMAVLWTRVAPRAPEAPAYLVATALLLTPFVMVPLALGQNSPVLFLSAAVGVRWAVRWPQLLATAAIVVLAVVFKLFPIALLGILVWQRRWQLLAWTVGLLVAVGALTAALVDGRLWRDFWDASAALAPAAPENPYNGSISALLDLLGLPMRGAAGLVVLAVTGAAALAVLVWLRRRVDDDTMWAGAWVLLLVVVPMVWWHYLWVAVAAVAYAWVAGGARPRRLWCLPALAALTFPISIPNGRGFAVPWAQALFLVAVVALVAWLVGPVRRQAITT